MDGSPGPLAGTANRIWNANGVTAASQAALSDGNLGADAGAAASTSPHAAAPTAETPAPPPVTSGG